MELWCQHLAMMLASLSLVHAPASQSVSQLNLGILLSPITLTITRTHTQQPPTTFCLFSPALTQLSSQRLFASPNAVRKELKKTRPSTLSTDSRERTVGVFLRPFYSRRGERKKANPELEPQNQSDVQRNPVRWEVRLQRRRRGRSWNRFFYITICIVVDTKKAWETSIATAITVKKYSQYGHVKYLYIIEVRKWNWIV